MGIGREIDARIAEEVFGHEVAAIEAVLHERVSSGLRPLLKYSQDIEAAWLVAEKMQIAVLPVSGQCWFAMVGKSDGFRTPIEFLEFMQEAKFKEAGAAFGSNPAETICRAALYAVEKRRAAQNDDLQ